MVCPPPVILVNKLIQHTVSVANFLQYYYSKFIGIFWQLTDSFMRLDISETLYNNNHQLTNLKTIYHCQPRVAFSYLDKQSNYLVVPKQNENLDQTTIKWMVPLGKLGTFYSVVIHDKIKLHYQSKMKPSITRMYNTLVLVHAHFEHVVVHEIINKWPECKVKTSHQSSRKKKTSKTVFLFHLIQT